MTIWKSKDKQPIQVDAIYILCCFYGEEEPSYNLMSALSYKDIGYYCVKWCYLDDLLALEQQNESLYQNQMSIIETNKALIKRLKEAESVIEFYNGFRANKAMIDNKGNITTFEAKAQEYLNKYKEQAK